MRGIFNEYRPVTRDLVVEVLAANISYDLVTREDYYGHGDGHLADRLDELDLRRLVRVVKLVEIHVVHREEDLSWQRGEVSKFEILIPLHETISFAPLCDEPNRLAPLIAHHCVDH